MKFVIFSAMKIHRMEFGFRKPYYMAGNLPPDFTATLNKKHTMFLLNV